MATRTTARRPPSRPTRTRRGAHPRRLRVLRFTWTQSPPAPPGWRRRSYRRHRMATADPPRGSHRAGRAARRADTSGHGRVRRSDAPAQTPAARLRQIGADALYLLTRPLHLDRRLRGLGDRRDAVAHARAADRRLPDRARPPSGASACSPTSSASARRSCSARRSPPPTGRRPPTAALAPRLKRRRARPAALEGPRLHRAARRARLRVGHDLARAAGAWRSAASRCPPGGGRCPPDATYLWFTIDTFEESVGAAAIGVALLPVALLVQRPLALSQAHLARAAARPLARRPRRAADRDARGRRRRRHRRAAADRARPARRRAGAPGGARDGPRHGRGALRPRPRGARELLGEARREAKRALAELRDLARGMRPSLLRGARPRPGDRRARRPQPGAGHRRPSTSRASRRCRSRPPPGSSSPRRSPTPPSTAAPSAPTIWVTQRNAHLHVEVVDDGAAAPTRRHRASRASRSAVEALDGTLEVAQPSRRADGRASIAAVRVVIAEDLALLRDGLERLLRDSGFDVVAAVADGPALLDAVEHTTRTWRSSTSGSRPPSATRACAPRSSCAAAAGLPGPDPLPVRRADLRRRAAGRRRRRRRLPAQGPRVGRARVRRGGAARGVGRHGARPRGRVPARRPATRTARSRSSARASAPCSR